MKVYAIRKNNGLLFAFEIENTFIRINTISDILENIDGVSDVKKRKPFSSCPDVHVKFFYMHKEFMVWEPYGDSSRYWIGLMDDSDYPIDVSYLVEAFENYNPKNYLKVFCDVFKLNFRYLLEAFKSK